ncbi:MAG: hypothetical protein N2450_01490 [bacterium]|nr:hypothetical protein [bacterium]
MKREFILFLIIMVATSSSLSQVGPAIEHTPIAVTTAGQPLRITMQTMYSSSDVSRAVVAYRVIGEASYHEIELVGSGNTFVGEIPASAIKDAGLEYFLFIVKKDGTKDVFPPSLRDIPENPFRVTVRAAGGASGVYFELVAPDAMDVLDVNEINVISIAVIGGELDVATARLVLNGSSVTRFANVTPELVSFIAKGLKVGNNTISLSGKTKKGADITPLQVTIKAARTEISGKELKRFNFQADAWTETRLEQLDNSNFGGKKETEWYQRENVQFRGRYGSMDFGGRFYVTNEEKRYEQPRNRYQIWLRTKWLKLGFGDNSPYYTPLTLSGKRVRGLELGLHGSGAHLEIVTGYTDRAIEYYSNPPRMAFAKELTAIRNWYGSEFGTRGGFTLMKVRDNRFSINKDTAKTFGITPIENLVLSNDWQFSFDNQRILLNAEVAWSLYNRDIGPGSVDKDSLKKLPGAPDAPIDPKDYEKYIVINDNLVPLDPSKSTNLAYFTELRLNYFNNLFQFKYRYTGPAFTSLGSPFVISDDKGFTISDRIRLLDNRLYLTLGYETAQNNLDDNSATGTVKTGSFNFDLGYYPTNVSMPDITISYRGGERKNDITDTTAGLDNRVKESMTSTSVYLGKNFEWAGYSHSTTFLMNSFSKKDKYSRVNGSPYGAKSSLMSLSFQTAWDQTLKTTLSYSNLKSETPSRPPSTATFVNKSTTYSTVGLRGDKSFAMNKLQTFLGLAYQSASGLQKFSKTTITMGSAYYFPANFVVRLQADVANSSVDVQGQNKSTSETFAFFRLEKKF